jgi:hypothetical protein
MDFLMATSSSHPTRLHASGPYIYDKFGNLVWDGYGAVGAANTHNFHVCPYQGVDHLCMMVSNQEEGYAFGMGIIVDSDYHIVASVQSGDSLTPVDMHEFWLTEDGETAMITAYSIIPALRRHEPAGMVESGRLPRNQHHHRRRAFRVVLFESR